MNGLCPLCDGPAGKGHHVTGRGADGRYLDPESVLRTCHDDHMLLHDDWNTLGAADGAANCDHTFLGSLEVRLTRTAALAGRVAETAPPPFSFVFALVAQLLAAWASRLSNSLSALDRYSPGWRASPGV